MTDHDLDILARTLYGEARGEYGTSGPAAFIAIGNVIMNRFQRGGPYGKTITEVCLKARQFSCWNSNDPNRPLIQQEEKREGAVVGEIKFLAIGYPLVPSGCSYDFLNSCIEHDYKL